MRKNYYEILEVDKNASPEIIEKAYKTLAKKYHPDLQEYNFKKDSEIKMQLINEAYETLSDPEKKKNYDISLSETTISEDDISSILEENKELHRKINNFENERKNINNSNNNEILYSNDNETINQNSEYEQELQRAREKAYHDAYIQDLKNRGYRIKYKKTPKEHFKNFLALLITILILFLLWQIPFIQNFFKNMYYENAIVKILVDTILGLFK